MVKRPLILVPGILESSLAIEKDSEFFGIWPLTTSWVPLGMPLNDQSVLLSAQCN